MFTESPKKQYRGIRFLRKRKRISAIKNMIFSPLNLPDNTGYYRTGVNSYAELNWGVVQWG
jgi:hypothetical protein